MTQNYETDTGQKERGREGGTAGEGRCERREATLLSTVFAVRKLTNDTADRSGASKWAPPVALAAHLVLEDCPAKLMPLKTKLPLLETRLLGSTVITSPASDVTARSSSSSSAENRDTRTCFPDERRLAGQRLWARRRTRQLVLQHC
ncbi:hypothetical protein E2C01_063792 [Portunus trituberculatus]|uniref:Uncharacterized protein n=1 Tax=Portunus trituberculatus TaxID=210409 RepID=A0A5B7HJ52_PORTR|nr:hypothetical protein [Portunus trituberculatus]